MPFRRSLRRQIACGATLLLVINAILSFAGFSTLLALQRADRFLSPLASGNTNVSPRVLEKTLGNINHIYETRYWLIIISALVSTFIVLGLALFFFRAVVHPFRQLHQAAIRIAQGDFDYRINIVNQNEISELATAFNSMTDRFQEINEDLDRQVQERSKQLVRSERLAGIGFLAAGVAHELGNPLAAVAMASEVVRNKVATLGNDDSHDDLEIVRECCDMIEKEARRCRNITSKLLDFARGDEVQRNTVDLKVVVKEVVAMVAHLSEFRNRHVEFDHPKPCIVDCNGPQIKQVVLNLVSNGLQSMEDGGILRIRLIEKTDEVLMTFEDDGSGMTPAVIEHLFEPFFTQRKSGVGTGLGLSISHRIITEHDGWIQANSDGLGSGSVFTVRLPRRGKHIQNSVSD